MKTVPGSRINRFVLRFFVFTFILLGASQSTHAELRGGDRANGGSIGSLVWLDTNRDAIRDKNEVGVAGVSVSLLRCDGSFVAAQNTNAKGGFNFSRVAQGCYRLRYAAMEGYRYCPVNVGSDAGRDSDADPSTGLTTAFNLGINENMKNLDAGVVAIGDPQIGDRVWEDRNADGIQNVGEVGLSDVAVDLLDCAGTAVNDVDGNQRTAITDSDGFFVFEDLADGCYAVRVNTPANYEFSARDMTADLLDSDTDPVTGIAVAGPISTGQGLFSIDAGMYRKATIGDWIWLDSNRNNIQDPDETGLADVQVMLLDAGGVPLGVAVHSAADGFYEFSDVTPGIYRLQFVLPAGHIFGHRGLGGDTQLDSNVNALGITEAFEVVSGGQHYDIDVAARGDLFPYEVTAEKLTNGVDADLPPGPYVEVGGDVLWEYVLTNTGGEDLFALTIVDNQGVSITCPQVDLLFGETITCTGSTDDAQAGQYVNEVYVCGRGGSPDGLAWCDKDLSHYFGSAPGITIEKSTNGADADAPTGPLIPVGSLVTWEYFVLNTGNVVLTDVTVIDDQGVTVTCPTDTLPPGVSMSCSATGIATIGQYANLGSVTGTPPVGDPVTDSDPSHYFGQGVSINIEKSTNGVDADTPTGPTVAVGSTVNWVYTVTNTGAVTLFDVVVTDDQGVIVSCPATSLIPGASMDCTGSGIALDGQYANIGTACGNDGSDDPMIACDDDPSHYLGVTPGIDIEKATNGQDADTPTGPSLPIGSTVDWTYIVTNTGAVTLTDIVVTDDQGVAVSCPATSLAPGDSFTCTASGIATAGQYANLGSVIGTPPVGDPVTDSDPSHYFGVDLSIALEKLTNGVDADTPTGPTLIVGSTVTWTYFVINTGNVTIFDLVVTDDQGVIVTCPVTSLIPGHSVECTGTGIVQEGQYANMGTACADDGSDDPMTVCDDDPSHYIGVTPSIDIEKATNGEDADTPTGPTVLVGSTVNWTYVVTNTGTATLTDIVVTDDQGVAVSCPATTLAPGDSFTCTASGIATAGQYANLGSVIGTPPVGDPVTDSDPSHYLGVTPSIDIEKATNGIDADTPTGPTVLVGSTVNWTYLVTNTGTATLTDIVVTDDQGVAVSCPATTLAPGDSFTCTASGIATAGQYANLGSVIGTPPVGDPVTDTDPSHYLGVTPSIDIEKATNGEDADTPTGPTVLVGSTVNWTYVVTNTGPITLIDIVVTDDQGVAVSCPTTTLAPGDSFTCTGTGIAQAGQYANIGSVTGQGVDPAGDPIGDPVSDLDPSHYLGVTPSIDIEKATNGEDADTPTGPTVLVGSTVNWTYVVTNTGPITLIDIVVTDDQGVAVSCPATTLLAGASFTCTGTGIAQAGQYANIGSVTGQGVDPAGDPIGDPVSDLDPSHYLGVTPSIDIEKATNGEDADTPTGPTVLVGSTVNWTYVVTNTGTATLTDIVVTDDQGVAVSCPATTLAPGDSFTCTASGIATAGQYANLGSVIGTPPVGDPVTDTDPSHYIGVTPSIDIEKATNGEDADTPTGPTVLVGSTVNWTYLVTNTGTATLTDIVVTDDQGVAVSCPATTLAPGDSFTCTASGIATAGQYANLGSVIGTPPVGDPVTDTDPSHYLGLELASLGDKVFKDLNSDGQQDAGEPGVPGITVNLWTDDDGDGLPDTLIATTVTDADGLYGFTDLDPTLTYVVEFVNDPAMNMPFTTPNVGDDATDSDAGAGGITGPITLTSGENNLTIDAGLVNLPASLGDKVFKDLNSDGQQDAGEPGVPGITVNLWTDDDGDGLPDTLIATTVTDADGLYGFTDLDPTLTYVVEFVNDPAMNMPFTTPNVGDDATDSDAGAGGITGPIMLTSGENNPTIDAGLVNLPASLGDKVFKDLNSDGQQDAGEPGVPGITVNLWTDDDGDGSPDTLIATTVTDADGLYGFTDLDPTLTYVVEFVNDPAMNMPFTTPNVGDDATDSDAGAGGITGPITLTSGENNLTIDAGLVNLPASLGDFVWIDLDRDGIQDVGEPGVPGAIVNLWTDDDGDGLPDTLIATTTTDANGMYNFLDLDPTLIYVVQFEAIPGKRFTVQGAGGDPALDSNPNAITGITGPITLDSGEHDPTIDAGVIMLSASIEIEKATNGEDADTPTGPTVVAGSTVTWTYVVFNSGELTLSGVTVIDDQGVTVTCPGDTLTPGASFTCTASGTAINGQYANIGSVTGQPIDGGEPVGTPVSDDDPSHYFGETAQCSIVINKMCRVEQPIVPGDECQAKLAAILLQYIGPTISGADVAFAGNSGGSANYSNVDLISDVTVLSDQNGYSVDSSIGGQSDLGARLNISINGVTEEIHTSCSIPVIVGLPAPLNSGAPSPNWLVLGFRDKNGIVSEPIPDDGVFEENCEVAAGGQNVDFSYQVTNTGDVPVFDISVEDSILGTIPGSPISTLGVGQSETLLASDFVDITTIMESTATGANADGAQCVTTDTLTVTVDENVCVDGFVADNFGSVSYANNDGDMNWNGPWMENDPQGDGASGGAVRVESGMLVLTDYPDSGQLPSIKRSVDLTGYPAAMLMFDWSISLEANANDKAVIEISSDGGATFTVLEQFQGVADDTNGGAAMYDISAYISDNTIIRFRIHELFGAVWDKFMIDNVRIDKKCVPPVCVAGNVADHFGSVSYANNDGNMDWSGSWLENDPQGDGASGGAVRVESGMLVLTDYPDSGQSPSIKRSVDLTGYPAAMLMFDWAISLEANANDKAVVEISSDGGATYTVLEQFQGVSDDTNGGSVMYDITPYISDNTTIRFRIHELFGAVWDKFMIDNVRIDKKCDPTDDCVVTGAPDHAFWMANFNDNGVTDRFDFDPGASFARFDDGTARLTGIIRDQNSSGRAFEVDIMLSGLTATPPPGSPKNGYGADPSDWLYYPVWNGVLTGIDSYAGAELVLTRRGPSFQIGTGANDQPDQIDVYGASGWLDWETTTQSDLCYSSGTKCIADTGIGDINVVLECGAPPPPPPPLLSCVANETPHHAFYFPDFNDDGVLDRYDLDNGATFVQNADGSAQLTGTIRKQGEPSYAFDINVTMSGRTDTPPPGSPYNPQNADPSDWQYYPMWSGVLTGIEWNNGASLNITRRGAAFQIGTGANAHSGENAEYGGSGWFDWTATAQPVDCASYSDCIATSGNGDINIRLDCGI